MLADSMMKEEISTAIPTKLSSLNFCSPPDLCQGVFFITAPFRSAFNGLELDFQGTKRTTAAVATSLIRNSDTAIASAIINDMGCFTSLVEI